MKKLFIVLLLAISAFSTEVMAQELPIIQYEESYYAELITESSSQDKLIIHKEDVSYVKVHFSKFNIPKGVLVTVSNPEGTESYTYSKYDTKRSTKKPGDGPQSFSAMSISGDTAVITIDGYHENKNIGNNLIIDSVIYGLPEEEIERLYQEYEQDFVTESTCGVLDRKPTECYKDSFPIQYDRARPVARITNGTGSRCTAWRVGSDNRMITNNHCNATQEHVAASEVWFNYEYTTCGWTSPIKTGVVKLPGETMLYTDRNYDITLFTIGNFELAAPFGYLGLEPRHAIRGERIYIPGHGEAKPKQLVIESDLNASGFCEIDDESRDGFGRDSDYGYWCDSIGGQSGSPVINASNHRAIALHHFGGCMNAGTKVAGFWPSISGFFDGVIPQGDNDTGTGNKAPIPDIVLECVYGECSYDGSGSVDEDGEIVGYTWRFGDGTTSNEISGTHTYDTTGVYVVSLEVQDNLNGYGYDGKYAIITLEGENIKPVAVWTYKEEPEDYTVTFTDDGSYDWDGEIVDWQWIIVDSGTRITYPRGQKEVTHTFQVGGRQLIYLYVWDDFGASVFNSQWITVNGPIMNASPKPSFSTEINYNTVTFTDTTTDDGEIVYWRWIHISNNPDIPNIYRNEPVHTVTFEMVPGELSRELKTQLQVKDNYGAFAWINGTYIITAPPTPQPPVAEFTYNCQKTVCSFDGTSSYDPDGGELTYSWDFGNPTPTSGAMVDNDFGSPGVYNVTLTVTDNEGDVDFVTKAITTLANVGPTAAFTYNCNNTLCTFDGTSSSDPDGGVVSYSWDFGNPTPTSGAVVNNDFGAYGDFVVTLMVTDEEGETDTSVKTITLVERLVLEVSVERLKKGNTDIQLNWNVVSCKTPGCNVDVYLGGSWAYTTPHDGSWSSIEKLKNRHTVHICLSDGSQCSNVVSLK